MNLQVPSLDAQVTPTAVHPVFAWGNEDSSDLTPYLKEDTPALSHKPMLVETKCFFFCIIIVDCY